MKDKNELLGLVAWLLQLVVLGETDPIFHEENVLSESKMIGTVKGVQSGTVKCVLWTVKCPDYGSKMYKMHQQQRGFWKLKL